MYFKNNIIPLLVFFHLFMMGHKLNHGIKNFKILGLF